MRGVAGVDPGSTGAITTSFEGYQEVFSFEKFTYVQLLSTASANRFRHIHVAYFERVGGRRGDFVNKAFAFGRNTGRAELVMEYHGIEIVYVESTEWKKMFGLLRVPEGKKKAAEQAAVNKTWPHLKITQNAAASACLALYGEAIELGL